jgi:hypothetical protein
MTGTMWPPIPGAVRSKAWVCGRLLTGIAGSNPAGGCLSVVSVVCCQVVVSVTPQCLSEQATALFLSPFCLPSSIMLLCDFIYHFTLVSSLLFSPIIFPGLIIRTFPVFPSCSPSNISSFCIPSYSSFLLYDALMNNYQASNFRLGFSMSFYVTFNWLKGNDYDL